jgi:hypothetical protein
MFIMAPDFDLIALQDSQGERGQNSLADTAAFLGNCSAGAARQERAQWSNVELFQDWPPSCHWSRADGHCHGRAPAPMSRILQQIQLAAQVLGGHGGSGGGKQQQIIAWEWTSSLSPNGGTGKDNITKLTQANYKAYAEYVHADDTGDRERLETPPDLKTDDEQQWLNPLAGLPPLARVHHSWPICRDGVASSPCPTPIESSNEAMADYARITHAFPLSVAFGGQWEQKQPWPFNHTELREAVKLCYRSNASLSLNYSPWYAYWEPHCKVHCDPTSRVGEAAEISFYSARLREIAASLAQANRELGSHVPVGAVLLDSEKLSTSWKGNMTMQEALTRKHNLMYDASKAVFPQAVVEQYSRGSMVDEKAMAHTASALPFAYWPVYTLAADERSDGFATSLYSIPEVGQTRAQFRATAANARAHNVSSVTPWLALGQGYRRSVPAGTNYWDAAWDYGYEYSWLLGREIADPFYAANPEKFAPWDLAKRVCLYPSPFETAQTKAVQTANGSSTLIMMHFVAYVAGSADIGMLPPVKSDDQTADDRASSQRPETSPNLKTDDDMSGFVILAGANMTDGERYASTRLKTLLQLPTLSGSAAIADTAATVGRRIIAIGSEASLKLLPSLGPSLSSLGQEGFIVQTTPDAQSVAITGAIGAARGAMYGAYRFLEAVGYDFLSCNVTNVPQSVRSGAIARGELWNGSISRREVPVLEWRHNNNANLELQEHIDFAIALGNNQNGGTRQYTSTDVHKPGAGVRWSGPGFTETSFTLVPPSKYWVTHPEWYAGNCTVGAKGCNGGAGNQLCWSNRTLQEFLARRAIDFLRQDPLATMVAIEQNDERGGGPRPCMRPADLAVFQEEKSWSGPLLRAVNFVADEVAKAFPSRDVRVSTLAYVHTQEPPMITKPRENVVIRLVCYHCGFGIPLTNASSEGDLAFLSQLARWSKISPGRLWIWTWNTDFDNFVLPWPDYYSVGPNTRTFVEHGVTGAYQEGNFMAYVGDLQEMKSWVGQKILWDPSQSDTELITQFLRGWFCGDTRLAASCAAAVAVQRHIDLIHGSFLATASKGVTLSKGEGYTAKRAHYLTSEVVLHALANLRAAQSALGGGGDDSRALLPVGTVRERLQRVELGSLYVLLLRWHEMRDWASANAFAWPAEPTIGAAFDRFASWYRRWGMDRRVGYERYAARGVDIDYGLSSQPHHSLQWLNATISSSNAGVAAGAR